MTFHREKIDMVKKRNLSSNLAPLHEPGFDVIIGLVVVLTAYFLRLLDQLPKVFLAHDKGSPRFTWAAHAFSLPSVSPYPGPSG